MGRAQLLEQGVSSTAEVLEIRFILLRQFSGNEQTSSSFSKEGNIDRRGFVKKSLLAGSALALQPRLEAAGTSPMGRGKGIDARAYLETVLYTREEVDQWITGATLSHEKHDGEIGWIPQPCHVANGINGCTCGYSYEPSGARRMTAFAHRPCRINTYGDSFTHCDQVSDGESWQERLASHLCEPIRNFGVSGNSLYQAYVRMKREEALTPASYIIFNIHGGGFWSSLSPWASLGIPRSGTKAVRRPTVPYVKVNPATGEFVECANLCPTPESLYNLCDLDWTYEHLRDEFQLKIILARENIKRQTPEASYDEIRALAQAHGINPRIESAEELSAALDQVSIRAAVFCTFRIIEKWEEFAAADSKKIFYVLSHTMEDIAKWLEGGIRFDQTLVEFLVNRKLPYIDDLEVHKADFSRFKLSINEYLNAYYNGHYTPLGNFFQAFAMKNKVVEILIPKPMAYSALRGDCLTGCQRRRISNSRDISDVKF
jgi:hypothetical protein